MPARTPQRPKSHKIMRKPKARRSPARPRALGKATFNIQRAVVEPGNADPETMLAIQRAYGNRATQLLTDRSGGHQTPEAGVLGPDLSGAIERSRGGGQPLAAPIRGPLEQSFQSDFGAVRVHTDARADTFNHAVQAKAFTLGHDIYFSKDNYNPGTTSGKKLLAHELTHVVQQTGTRAPAVQRKPDDPTNGKQFKAADPNGQIAALHPSLQTKVQTLIENAHKKGLDIFVFQGLRTIAEQDDLYAQGRTKKGPIVTKAKGGESYHNYGVAVDIVFHGAEPWGEKNDWQALGAAGQAAGLEWGGSWASFQDRPHFQLPGLQVSQMQAWYANGGMTNVWKNIDSAPSKSAINSSTQETKNQPATTNDKPGDKKEEKPVTDVVITYGSNANSSVVNEHTLQVLKRILGAVGEKSVLITSTVRDPYNQARIMYGNIVTYGVAAQKKLYGNNGDAVIDVCAALQKEKKKDSEIIKAMEAKIIELGPITISKHCGDPKVLQVVDIAPSSITRPAEFRQALQAAMADGTINRVIFPPDDPAYHIEISAPALATNEQTQPTLADKKQPDTKPNSVETGKAALPKADLGKGQADWTRRLDWDKQDKTIAQDKTLRVVFENNLAVQLKVFFGSAITRDQVLKDIQQAEASGKTADADALRAKLFKANEYAVVETLNVEKSDRYRRNIQGHDETYCNIYSFDVVNALGGYLPRVWWTAAALQRIQAGEQVKPTIYSGKVDTVHEMSANALVDWIKEFGNTFGWRKQAGVGQAQDEANKGKLVILLAAQLNNAPGHVNVILPETEQYTAKRDDKGQVNTPLQSQAGGTNFKHSSATGLWWQGARYRDGAAWVFEGEPSSSLLTPEQLGGVHSGITASEPVTPDKNPPKTESNTTKPTTNALNTTQSTTPEKKTPATTTKPKQVTTSTSGKTKKSADELVMDQVRQYDPHIKAASQKFGVPVETIRAIIATESGGKPEASSGAAFGLMQITQDTWEGTRKQYPELQPYVFSKTYWSDPQINILVGTAVFKGKMQVIGVKADDDRSAELAVVAYNAGEYTIKMAMKNAQAAGSQDPAGDCLKPEYLKPAIENYKIHRYYLTGRGKQDNPYVNKKDGTVAPQDEKKALQSAIDLKYNEIAKYPGKVRKYIAVQGSNSGSTPNTETAAQGTNSGSTPSTDKKEEKQPSVPKLDPSIKKPMPAVTIGAVNVRQGPEVTSTRLGTLVQGTQVLVIGRAGEWLQITYQGKAAYIHGNYAKFTPTVAASKSNFVDQTLKIGKGLVDQATQAGKDIWNWVSKQFDLSASKPAYENQRDNAYDKKDDNGKRVYGGVMCNVTTLAMQLETLAGNKEKAVEAAVQLLQKNGDKTPVPELRQKQLEDLLMLRFDQATKKNEWPTLLGKEYKQALEWHNQKIPWNQIACALNRIGLEFTAFVARTEHNEPDDGKGNTQEKLLSEEYYRKTLGPLAEKQKATVMLSTQMTSGHIVLFAQALSDGILINDPYGALLKEAGAGNYITNGQDKNTAAKQIKAAGDQVIKDRLKQNRVALKSLMSVISSENKVAAKVPQNIGELNFYTWSEIKKFTIGKWNNILFKK